MRERREQWVSAKAWGAMIEDQRVEASLTWAVGGEGKEWP